MVGPAAAAGGRPRLGGCATGTSGGEVQGFSRRVETVSTLSPTCNLKKRRERSRTRNGPSYAAVRGGTWPFRRASTCFARRRASGSSCGAGAE